MKTVVYQSYRTSNVPGWIEHCMATVRSWADAQGYDYHFVDDRLFEYAPQWYRRKVSDNILLISDLARLMIARELLRGGYQRTVWIDADVVVFSPGEFRIDTTEGYALCREIWVGKTADGQMVAKPQVNNAVTVFVEPNSFLDFYIHACEQIVRQADRVDPLAVGTSFLTGLRKLVPFGLIEQVGLFSPILMQLLAKSSVENVLQQYAKAAGGPIHAANLCSSFRNSRSQGVDMTDELYSQVVLNLIASKRPGKLAA
jgi:hypothetical protein